MKKIMFWGDSPALGTGFGNVIKFIIKHLPKDKYTPVVLGVYHDNKKHDLPYKIYSVGLYEEQKKAARLKEIIKKEKPDILFILGDVWYMSSIIMFLGKNKFLQTIKTVGYIPADAEDHDPHWYEHTHKLDRLVVYNEFGKSVVAKAAPKQEVSIIEHGIDNTVFYPLTLPRAGVRNLLFENAPELDNSFVFLNAGRNQPRKLLDISMRAFAEFAKDKHDVYLYMHCGVTDAHIDILRMANLLDIQDKILMTADQHGRISVPIEHLNVIYNFCDVGLNSGVGEGFGLPNAEHASLGKPQIVPDHSALTELYSDCGLLVPANIKYMLSSITTTAKMIMAEDMAEKMELIYKDRELYKELSEKSKAKFTSDRYSWAKITEQWVKLFDEL